MVKLDGVLPKVVVIMIGTNNTGHRKDPPKAIAAGIEKIIERIRKMSPETKILLLGIFPRSEKITDPQRRNNDSANTLIAKLGKKDDITYLDINERFLLPDGTLSKEIMPDLLHPKQKGYAIWAEAIEPSLRTLLAEDQLIDPSITSNYPPKAYQVHMRLDVTHTSSLVKNQFAGASEREAVDLVAVQNLPFSVSLQEICRRYDTLVAP